MNVGRFRPPPYEELMALARKPLQLAAGVVPASANYRLAEACGTCSHYEESGRCALWDADVDEEYVCDEWAGDGQP